MERQPYPTDLTDAQWARIEPLIPPAKRGNHANTACFPNALAVSDMLARLAKEQTMAWAEWEEWGLKLLCRLAARIEALRPGSRLAFTPWVDVYYAKREGGTE